MFNPKLFRSPAVLSILIMLAVFVVYSNVYGNVFVYDDEFLIEKNLFIRSWEHLWAIFSSSSTEGAGKTDSFYRPIQALLYLMVFQWGGLSPDGFHLLNVSLHAANGVLIFLFARRMGFREWTGFVGALIWAVHPVHTEAITYMSGTADPLHTFFILSGLTVAVPAFTLFRVVIATLFFLLALMSKESAIVFPVLAMVCLFYLRPDRWKLKTYIPTIPFWALAVVYLIARQTILNFDDSFTFYKEANIYTENIWFRVLTFFASLTSYFQVLINPVDLHIDRNFPVFVSFGESEVQTGAALFAILLLLILPTFWGRGLFLAWISLWFLGSHFPHSGILVPMNALFLEHWLYLTSIGFFLGLGSLVVRLPSTRMHVFHVVVVLGAAGLLGVRTLEQNRVWADPVSLYSHILKFSPKAARIHNNLAMAYSEKENHLKAIEHYERAIALSDVYPESHHNLGLAYLRMGRIDEGIAQLEKAVAMNPNFFFSYEYLAHAYMNKGETVKAEQYRQKFMDLRRRFHQE